MFIRIVLSSWLSMLTVIALMVVVIGCSGGGDSGDRKLKNLNSSSEQAGKVFLAELCFLDSVVTGQFDDKPGAYPLNRIQKSISFMERLTGQASKADGTYIGRIAPTSDDVHLWSAWFALNKDCLFLCPDSVSVQLDSSCLSQQRGDPK